MVYTVTFNPSLDYIISVEDFAIGRTNRTGTEQLLVGGKGINVSIVLNNLGVKIRRLVLQQALQAKKSKEALRRSALKVILSGFGTDFQELM